MVIVGDYSVSGNVLILPIQGEGKCNLTLDDIDAVIKFIPQTFIQNNQNQEYS